MLNRRDQEKPLTKRAAHLARKRRQQENGGEESNAPKKQRRRRRILGGASENDTEDEKEQTQDEEEEEEEQQEEEEDEQSQEEEDKEIDRPLSLEDQLRIVDQKGSSPSMSSLREEEENWGQLNLLAKRPQDTTLTEIYRKEDERRRRQKFVSLSLIQHHRREPKPPPKITDDSRGEDLKDFLKQFDDFYKILVITTNDPNFNLGFNYIQHFARYFHLWNEEKNCIQADNYPN